MANSRSSSSLARSAILSGRIADLPSRLTPTVEQFMHTAPFWPDDFSELSHEGVLTFMAENRAWNKRLREGTAALVNKWNANNAYMLFK